MNAPVRVPTNSRLCVEYTVYPAPQPKSTRAIALHHGIFHSRLQFQELIQSLNAAGFHAVMIDQQSESAGTFRNLIGAKQYRDGMAAAVSAIEQAGIPVGWYVCHSMGALIAEEMQQHYPQLRRPTVFMAPIPVDGSLPIAVRILLRHPKTFLKCMLTLTTLKLSDTPEETRELFFDANTLEHVVTRTTRELKHAPFWIFLQLTFRWAIRPRIRNDGLPKMLLLSPTDEIFHVKEFKKTSERYPQMPRQEIPGGHDFFIENADLAARGIAEFCGVNE